MKYFINQSFSTLLVLLMLFVPYEVAEAAKTTFMVQVETQKNIKEVDRVIKKRLDEIYGGFFTRIKSTITDNKRIAYVVNSFADVAESDLRYYIETRGVLKVYVNESDPWFSSADIINAAASFDAMEKPVLRLTLTDNATKILAKKTAVNINQLLTISLDDQILTKARIMEPLKTKYLQVAVGDSVKQAHRTALLLRTGALPEKVKLLLKSLVRI